MIKKLTTALLIVLMAAGFAFAAGQDESGDDTYKIGAAVYGLAEGSHTSVGTTEAVGGANRTGSIGSATGDGKLHHLTGRNSNLQEAYQQIETIEGLYQYRDWFPS